jgi:hypothetical protein
MARALHVRLDGESEAALAVLRAEGMSDSQAVRRALAEARSSRRRRVALRQEAHRLANDPVDRALRGELDELMPEWPAD